MIKLTWVDVGRGTEPGRYHSRYGLIEITSDDLWVWQNYPNAAFVVIQPSPFSEETECRLGTFELRENWIVPGHEKGVEPSEGAGGDEEIDDGKRSAVALLTEPGDETQIDPRLSVELRNDLQSRIDALMENPTKPEDDGK